MMPAELALLESGNQGYADAERLGVLSPQLFGVFTHKRSAKTCVSNRYRAASMHLSRVRNVKSHE